MIIPDGGGATGALEKWSFPSGIYYGDIPYVLADYKCPTVIGNASRIQN